MERLNKMIKSYAGLPKSIYILFIARVVNSIGMFVYPFLTFFLKEKMGFGEEKIGTYILWAAVAAIPGALIGGWLTDHFGRKKILIIFQSLAAMTFIIIGFFGTSIMVPKLLIVAVFLGAVAEPASGAMVTDLTNPENRKEAFSLLYLGINIGAAIGPMLAGFLFRNYTRWIFWGDGITSIIAIVLVAIYVDETKPTKEEIENREDIINSDEKAENVNILVALMRRPILLTFALLSSVLAFVYAQNSFSVPLQLSEIFSDGPKVYGTFLFVNAVVVLIMTAPLASLTKRFKPIQNVSFSAILYAIGFGMIYFIDSYIAFIISTIIWTLGEIVTVTNTGEYIANHSPINHRGKFNTMIGLIRGIGGAVAPRITGAFIVAKSIRMVWPLMFVVSMVTFVLLNILHKIENNKGKLDTFRE